MLFLDVSQHHESQFYVQPRRDMLVRSGASNWCSEAWRPVAARTLQTRLTSGQLATRNGVLSSETEIIRISGLSPYPNLDRVCQMQLRDVFREGRKQPVVFPMFPICAPEKMWFYSRLSLGWGVLNLAN